MLRSRGRATSGHGVSHVLIDATGWSACLPPSLCILVVVLHIALGDPFPNAPHSFRPRIALFYVHRLSFSTTPLNLPTTSYLSTLRRPLPFPLLAGPALPFPTPSFSSLAGRSRGATRAAARRHPQTQQQNGREAPRTWPETCWPSGHRPAPFFCSKLTSVAAAAATAAAAAAAKRASGVVARRRLRCRRR